MGRAAWLAGINMNDPNQVGCELSDCGRDALNIKAAGFKVVA